MEIIDTHYKMHSRFKMFATCIWVKSKSCWTYSIFCLNEKGGTCGHYIFFLLRKRLECSYNLLRQNKMKAYNQWLLIWASLKCLLLVVGNTILSHIKPMIVIHKIAMFLCRNTWTYRCHISKHSSEFTKRGQKPWDVKLFVM